MAELTSEGYLDLSDAEKNSEISQFEAGLAGIASGLIKVPEGVISLGAELIDLGLDTNSAAQVEQFFDKINPFEEIAAEKEREGDWTTMDYAYGDTGANWFSNDKKGTSKSKSKNPSYFTGSKACPVHDGTTVVFKRNYKHLSGAQGGEVAIDSELKLVVDLAGIFKSKPDLKAIEFTKGTTYTDGTWEKDMSNLNAHVRGPAVLRIENPDMKIPPVGFSFWKELWNLLPKGRTVCCCVGGHGRTGTALAALLLAADKQLDAKAAISLVRKKHCEKAIESSMQERYLKLLAKERDASV